MPKSSLLLVETEQLLRWINARNPPLEAKEMEEERASSGVAGLPPLPFRTEPIGYWRSTHKAVDWALRQLVEFSWNKGAKNPPDKLRRIVRDLLNHSSDRLSPASPYAPVAVFYSLSRNGDLTRREWLLSLPTAFGVTLAALMDNDSRVKVRQCAHAGCRRLFAFEQGRGSGKRGDKPRYCSEHTPDSTKADRESKRRTRK